MAAARREGSPASRVLLLTGGSGSGKSVLLHKLAASLKGYTLRGFISNSIEREGARIGWRLDSFSAGGGIFAHRDMAAAKRINNYGVDLALLERLTTSELRPDPRADIYLIDEVGRFGAESDPFKDAVNELLESGAVVVATVHKSAPGWVRQIRERPGATVYEVTEENRERLLPEIREWAMKAAEAGRRRTTTAGDPRRRTARRS